MFSYQLVFFSLDQVFEDYDGRNHHDISTMPSGQREKDSNGEGHCVWYGTEPNSRTNIAYDGPAKRLEDDWATRELQSICPELFDDLGTEIAVMTTSEVC